MAPKIFVCSRFPNFMEELRASIKNVEFYNACTIPVGKSRINIRVFYQ